MSRKLFKKLIKKLLKQLGTEIPKTFTGYLWLGFFAIFYPVMYLILAAIVSSVVFFIARLLVEWQDSIIASQSFFGIYIPLVMIGVYVYLSKNYEIVKKEYKRISSHDTTNKND